MSILIHCSEIRIWKEKDRFRIMAVQIDILRGFLGRLLGGWIKSRMDG